MFISSVGKLILAQLSRSLELHGTEVSFMLSACSAEASTFWGVVAISSSFINTIWSMLVFCPYVNIPSEVCCIVAPMFHHTGKLVSQSVKRAVNTHCFIFDVEYC